MALIHQLKDVKTTTGYDEDGREYLVLIEVREFKTFNGVDHKIRYAVNGKTSQFKGRNKGETLLYCSAIGKNITFRA